MTDKLAEAIEALDAYFDGKRPTEVFSHGDAFIYKLLTAARAYHALPVVDVKDEKKCSEDSSWEYGSGYDDAIDYLRATYPNGLVWKKEVR